MNDTTKTPPTTSPTTPLTAQAPTVQPIARTAAAPVARTAAAPIARTAAAPVARTAAAPIARTAAAGESQADLAILDKTMLFGGLNASYKAQILKVLQLRQYPAGTDIVVEGDVGDGLYIVRSGEVCVYTTNKELGVNLDLATLPAGAVFGEMAVLTQEKRSASVKAAATTSCYFLSVDHFNRLIERLPAVGLGIAKTLAMRVTELNKQQGVAKVKLSDYSFDPDVYRLLPDLILKKHKVIPVALAGNNLTVAMVNPDNAMIFDDLKRILRGIDLTPVGITEDDYNAFRKAHSNLQAQKGGLANSPHSHGADPSKINIEISQGEDSRTDISGAEVVAVLNQIFSEALERNTSDIHIDTETHGVIVRYRIDGILESREKLIPANYARPLFSRLKIIANMDPTERRIPQDGRISLSYRDHPYDFRVATMPVKNGERVTMRVLDSASGLLALDKLILAPNLAGIVEQLIHKPQGVLLVTGPTGSGKTTTLYSLLKARMGNSSHINIVTAEDPIEYSLGGIAQTEIHEGMGLTFPKVLRGFLRHDPDIILVGETRDAETARISVQAALTGHLVISSMHTNSAAESVLRLRDLGIESYLIGSALTGVLAQRLVRHNCPVCATDKEFSQPIADSLVEHGLLEPGLPAVFKEGTGCDNCKGTGYKGRVGIYEVMPIAESTKSLISSGASTDEIKADALKHGMVTLAQYASFLLKSGATSPSQVLSVMG